MSFFHFNLHSKRVFSHFIKHLGLIKMLLNQALKSGTYFDKIYGGLTWCLNSQKFKFHDAALESEKEEQIISSKNTNSWLQSAINDDVWAPWWEEKHHYIHPGKYHLSAVSLPNQVDKAAYSYLKKYDLEVITSVGKKLAAIIDSRKVCQKPQTLVKPHVHRRSSSHFSEETLDLVNLSQSEFNKILQDERKERNQKVYNWKQLIYDKLNTAGYLLHKSPACYASSLRVMNEIKVREPEFSPKSILDFGSGTGMCIWAANTLWKQSLKQYFCIESSKEMNDLSFYLFSGGNYEEALPGIFIRRFLPLTLYGQYDIVISAYSLSELPSEIERLKLLKLLWEKTQRYLVLIENGNFYGYYIIMEARNLLVHGLEGADMKKATRWSKFSEPAKLFAPCPHTLACPKWNSYSCSFAQKYIQPHYYSKICKPGSPSSLEKFSFIIFEKQNNQHHPDMWPRAVANPHLRKKCAMCHFCTPDGNIADVLISKKKHGKDLYQVSKFTKLGDSLPLFSQKSDD